MRQAERDQIEARQKLREWIAPGQTVYTILDSVSRSGMSRVIRAVILDCEDGKPIDRHPNHAIGRALGLRHGKRHGRELDGLVIGGCGMDMGFHLVYELSSVLYGSLRCENPACKGPRYPSGEYRTIVEGLLDTTAARNARYTCEHCHEPLAGGYVCLGKGRCPSIYHVNHRDRVRCEGTMVYNPDGPNTGDRCYWRRGTGWVIPTTEADPARIGPVDDPETESRWVRICPTCHGKGDLPNPAGPERFDLLHTDGYAIRQRWL